MVNALSRDRERGSSSPCSIFYIFTAFCCGWVVWTLPGLYPTHLWDFYEHLLLTLYLQYLWTLLGWEGPASALWWLTLCSGCCYRPHIPHLALALEHPPPVLSLTHLSLAMADTWSPVGSQLSCFPVLFSGAGWNSLVQFIPFWFCGQPWKLYSASLPAESSCAIELNFDIVTPRGMTANLEGEWLPEFQRQSLQKPSAFPPPTQQTSRFGRNQEKGD